MLDPGARGTQVKMGYSYVPPVRPLFHTLFPKTAISELDPGARGTQMKMGYSYVPPLRPLFHALFPKTVISEFFSSSRSYIRLKSQISGTFAFQSLKIEEKFSSYA